MKNIIIVTGGAGFTGSTKLNNNAKKILGFEAKIGIKEYIKNLISLK
tara:strand:- start:565 stop:705 length:141 start_codon:yes stop_codon:yes gene_type:complete